MTFNIGDTVKVIKNTSYSSNNIGNIGKITELQNDYFRVTVVGNADFSNFHKSSDLELVNNMFEDQWHLNDGKVTIPDDADKLEKDGSVVAFRKRKQPVFEFGDKVMYRGEVCIYLRKDRVANDLFILVRKNGSNINAKPCDVRKI